MKLMNVIIRGFRSIENMTIPFGGYGHKILVGKNESGKSNILKALQLLSGGTFSKEQLKTLFNDGSVTFQFELDQEESVTCRNVFMEKIFPKANPKLTKTHTVQSFYNEYAKILFSFHIDKPAAWTPSPLPNDIQIIDGWYRVKQDLPSTPIGHIPVDSYIHESYIEECFSKEQAAGLHHFLSTTNVEDIHKALHEIMLKMLSGPLPTIYWEYISKECDLPNVINLDGFSQNPDSCQPLKDMFSLAGYEKNDIPTAFLKAKAGKHNGIKNLLNKVNKKTNDHIKENWQEYSKEYGDVEIELRKDGDNIVIGIIDTEHTYEFKQRSYGFRRFISFLLLINQKSNSLILLDEPETGLHPSSAKDLRDVLIELGKKNIVVYATHSISMIDTQNIENNLIIFKEGEDTLSEMAKEDGTSSGELIYNAIGHSIYDDLKKKNILLEGYTDKKILKSFMQGSEWKDFGICYTDGVKNIEKIVPLLELADREYFILSDADEVAIQSQKKSNLKHWYTYTELESKVITLEDFYMKDFFNDITKSVLEENDVKTEGFSFDDITDNNKLNSVKNLLNVKNLSIKKKIINDIKRECANKATKVKIDAEKLNLVLKKLLEKTQLDE